MRIVLCFCLTIAFLASSAQKGYYPTTHPVVIDGSDEDWTIGEHMFDRETQITYAFRKDTANLYVLVRTNHPQSFMKMVVTGLEIWAHPEGKKRRTYGLMYPVTRERGAAKIRPDMDPQEFLRQNRDRIKLTNLFGDERGAITASLNQLDQPLKVDHKLHDDGYWVYELAIPISAFPSPKKKKKGVWQIGITTPDLDRQDAPDMNDMGGGIGMGGMNQPGMMGPGRMGMGGAMPGGGMAPRSAGAPSSISVWTKVVMEE